MRPRNIVNSQLKILTPVGIAMIIVETAKNALTLAPEPIVKKWCAQVKKEATLMLIKANTIDL